MIKVGFITTPLTNANSVRGVGFYTKRLLENMKPLAKDHDLEVIEIMNPESSIVNQMDLIHFPYFDLFYHTLPIFRSTKTVVTVHDVIPLEFSEHYPSGIRGRFNLQAQKLAISTVDMVITDSYASVKAIHKYLNVPHEKLKLVYLAADKKFKKILRPKNKFNLPKQFVLYVGDIGWNKNIPNLIDACELTGLPLVMVGRQAKELESMDLSHPELRHLINHKSYIMNHIIKLGFVSDEDLVDVYNLATVYCQPSFAEGFGLNPLEAMACGTPVASSNTSSLPEILGNTAAYFDPNDVNAIAASIKKAFNLESRIINHGFSWEKTAKETIMVYEEVMHES